MDSFFLWGWSVIRKWIALIGGAVVSVVLVLWGQYSTTGKLPARIWWTGIGIGFVLACYLSWRDEQAGRVEAEEKAKEDAPDFTGYINKMAFEEPVDGFCVAYLLVSIENIGKRRSILHNWRGYVQPPGKLQSEVRVPSPHDDEECVLETGVNRVTIAASEFISAKSYPTGVEPGNGCRGFLRAYIPAGLPDGARFSVTFRDVNKRIYECEYDTAMRRERADNVSALGGWPGVKIKHGRVTVAM